MPKRPTSSLVQAKPAKRPKANEDISALEKRVETALEENASLNPLADLLLIASSSNDEQLVLKAIFASYRLFVQICRKGLLRNVDEEAADEQREKKGLVRTWLIARLDGFTDTLCGLLKAKDRTLRLSPLKILFSLLRELSAGQAAVDASSVSPFDVIFFRKISSALLLGESTQATNKRLVISATLLDEAVCEQFVQTWLNVYADIRWYFLREATSLLSNSTIVSSNPTLAANSLLILENLTTMPSLIVEQSTSEPQKFWVEHLSSRPKRSKSKDSDDHDLEEANVKEEPPIDDWRTYFDEEQPKETATEKRSRRQRRVHTMTIHEQLHSTQAHRAVFTKCWLSLLPVISGSGSTSIRRHNEQSGRTGKDSDDVAEDSLSLVTRTLTVLHHTVLPHLTRPILIMDWVSACVDYGGNVGLLALNALFVLMTQYNLDYPKFYTRLYGFLDRNILHLKHRARFFRLAERFLSSTHLPFTLLASFLKRLSRLSLTAPPAAIITIIPFTYNLLKRHPALMVLIHRIPDSADSADDTGVPGPDPFLAEERDPTLTRAIDSSIWELLSHTHHYHPAVSTLARVFSEAFTKSEYAMEDFLDHTYGTLIETEVNRKIRKDPPVTEMDLFLTPSVEGNPCMMTASGQLGTNRPDSVMSIWSLP